MLVRPGTHHFVVSTFRPIHLMTNTVLQQCSQVVDLLILLGPRCRDRRGR